MSASALYIGVTIIAYKRPNVVQSMVTAIISHLLSINDPKIRLKSISSDWRFSAVLVKFLSIMQYLWDLWAISYLAFQPIFGRIHQVYDKQIRMPHGFDDRDQQFRVARANDQITSSWSPN